MIRDGGDGTSYNIYYKAIRKNNKIIFDKNRKIFYGRVN